MGFNSKIFYVVVALMVLSGCTRTMGTETAFLKWLDDPDNGCVKAISANGFTMSLKYLPPEYLAYMESVEVPELERSSAGSATASTERQRGYCFLSIV